MACLIVLGCAVVYESLIAARVIPLGSESGRGAAGSGFVFVVALLALLCGAAVSAWWARTARPARDTCRPFAATRPEE